MNDLLWKGLTKGTTMYLDSQRNPTADFLIRSLRANSIQKPEDSKQNGIAKILRGKSINPITRSEILDDLNELDDSKKIIPLMYYYTWSKQDINNVTEWKNKYLYADIIIPSEDEIIASIELPTDEEINAQSINVNNINTTTLK